MSNVISTINICLPKAKETAAGAAGCARILSATIEAIIEAVAAGEKVTLVGFGSFESRERAAREGRNPQTGETLQIAALFMDGCRDALCALAP